MRNPEKQHLITSPVSVQSREKLLIELSAA